MNLHVDRILILARGMPTIMSASQELDLLQCLARCDERSLVNELANLLEVLAIVEESHSGGTVFVVTDLNYGLFVTAADWLTTVSRLSMSDQHRAAILGVAETLRTRFGK